MKRFIAIILILFIANGSGVFATTRNNTKSIKFDSGSTEYATIADGDQTGLDPSGAEMTISLWVNITTAPSNNGDPQVLASKFDASSNGFFFLYKREDPGAAYLLQLQAFDGGSHTRAIYTGHDLGTSTWVHLVGVWDLDSGPVINVWEDGVEDTGGTDLTAATDFGDAAGDYDIAYSTYFSAWPSPIAIDEYIVWDRALTDTEVGYVYNRNGTYCDLISTDANLQAYWRFEDTPDDETANNNDLTLVNTPTYQAGVPFASDDCGAAEAAASRRVIID